MIDSLPIFDKITWLPYHYFNKIRRNNIKTISLDMTKYGINKKFQMRLPQKDDGLSQQLTIYKFREPINCKYYCEFITEQDRLLDIGSNVGFFPILGGRASKIVCVEPLEELIPLLIENIRSNNLSEKSEIIHAAVGNKQLLYLEANHQMNLSKIVEGANGNTREVTGVTLRELVSKYDTNVIRMDVEGYEHEILFNQIPERVNKISLEFHTGLMGNEKSAELLNYFKQEGFTYDHFIEDIPLRLYPFLHVLRNPGLFHSISYAMANPDSDEVSRRILTGRSLKYLFLSR
jgi:FkbM family methyltransferase